MLSRLLLGFLSLSPFSLGAADPLLSALDAQGNLREVLPREEAAAGFAFKVVKAGVQFRAGVLVRNVLFYSPSVARVETTLGAVHTQQPSLVVLGEPAAVEFSVVDGPDTLEVVGGTLRIRILKSSGAVTFLDPQGVVLAREDASKPVELSEVVVAGAPTYAFRQHLRPAADESLYGLGQYNQPYMDYRGSQVLLVQTNIGIVVPFLLSTRRYGILWDTYSRMEFSDGPEGAELHAENAPSGLDYYVIQGATMDGVIAGYRGLTGAAPLPPKQAFGLFMSKERYKTQQRLVEVVERFRQERFPLDYIVQDWQYWGGPDGTWSGMVWDKERFPDPKGLTQRLHHDLHVKLMNSIWPSVGDDTELARDLDQKGLRFPPLHWISKKAKIYDAFSAEGRAIYFKHIKKGLLDNGVDALWMDGTEVEVGGACHDAAEVERDIKGLGVNALGDFSRYLNVYSLVTTKGTYEGQRATSDKRVFTLTRSAWAGQQRYAALPWSGDTQASWQTLRNQISGGVNVSMAGLPYWTQDTGGFFVNFPGGEKNPEYQELFVRWNQFGAFNPIYRIHGTDIEREPYVFKDLAPDVYASLIKTARLRYSLLPYLYSLAWKSTSEGYTIMRGLAMDFPDQENLRKVDDAYLFGPAFLVHPVTRAIYHVSPPPPATIPASALQTHDGKPGLSVQYFADTQLSVPAGATVDEVVDHRWPGPPLANPPPGLDRFTDFSGRWTGFLVAPEEGDYEISAEYDDGVRLFLDGKQAFEDWTSGPARYQTTRVKLQKGQRISLSCDYFQGGGDRRFRLAWKTPSAIEAFNRSKPVLNNVVETVLPAGTDWYSFDQGTRYPGGTTVATACTLDVFPLFVRAGSIVPLGPQDVQYATERPEAPLEIRVYPGAEGRFSLYEDDNETYAYERGEHSVVEMTWDDRAGIFKVGARKGSYPGMVHQRTFKIVVVGRAEAARTVEYSGDPITVNFNAP